MNNIAKLMRQRAQLARGLDAARHLLRELTAYVSSDKFADWQYVSTTDIVARCEHAQREIDFNESRCGMCGMQAATSDLICADCAEGVEYGKRLPSPTPGKAVTREHHLEH